MARYAENTSVSTDKSRAEIERTLMRYGADSFAYMTSRTEAKIGFQMNGRRIAFVLPLPDAASAEFQRTPERRNKRSPEQAHAAWEKACRQRWRALALVVKAKLEAVEAGIAEFEDEFMANILMADGQRFGEWARPQIALMYETGAMPALLGHDG